MDEWTRATAEWYATTYGEYPTNRLAVAALEVAPTAVVVDVGCGTGAALRHVAHRVPRGQLIGVDPVPRMVDIAVERAAEHPEGHRIEFRVGSAERLPIEAATADLVLAFDSIDHWTDRASGFAEVRRILRPHGRLVVVKDGGLPDGAEATRAFLTELGHAGFAIVAERTLHEAEVTAAMWVCQVAPPAPPGGATGTSRGGDEPTGEPRRG